MRAQYSHNALLKMEFPKTLRAKVLYAIMYDVYLKMITSEMIFNPFNMTLCLVQTPECICLLQELDGTMGQRVKV